MLIRNPEEEKREKEKYKKPFKVSLFYPFQKKRFRFVKQQKTRTNVVHKNGSQGCN